MISWVVLLLILIVLSVYDIVHGIIPPKIIGSGIVIATILAISGHSPVNFYECIGSMALGLCIFPFFHIGSTAIYGGDIKSLIMASGFVGFIPIAIAALCAMIILKIYLKLRRKGFVIYMPTFTFCLIMLAGRF